MNVARGCRICEMVPCFVQDGMFLLDFIIQLQMVWKVPADFPQKKKVHADPCLMYKAALACLCDVVSSIIIYIWHFLSFILLLYSIRHTRMWEVIHKSSIYQILLGAWQCCYHMFHFRYYLCSIFLVFWFMTTCNLGGISSIHQLIFMYAISNEDA